MNPKKPITNLTDLLINADVERLLTVNGFSLKGSDYDRFQRLCICMDQIPSEPIADSLREAYERVFPNELPLEARFCKEIWRRTSDLLLRGAVDPQVLKQDVKIHGEALPPQADFAERDAFLLNGMQNSAAAWSAWKVCATQSLDAQISSGMIPALSLTSEYRFQKPNLYQVERFLSGEGEREDLWLSQLLYFLCEIGYLKRVRVAILGEANFDELRKILQYVSRFTKLPMLFLQCKSCDSVALAELCSVIAEGNSSEEGVPPILLI